MGTYNEKKEPKMVILDGIGRQRLLASIMTGLETHMLRDPEGCRVWISWRRPAVVDKKKTEECPTGAVYHMPGPDLHLGVHVRVRMETDR